MRRFIEIITESDIPDSAERIAQMFRDKGISVISVNHSINRFGDKSSYIDIVTRRIRISDHSANTDYRVDEIDISPDASDEYIERIIMAEKKRRDIVDQKIKEKERKDWENIEIYLSLEDGFEKNQFIRNTFDSTNMTKGQIRNQVSFIKAHWNRMIEKKLLTSK